MGVLSWLNENVGSYFGGATDRAADYIEDATKDNLKISSADAKSAMPWLAAGGVALASWAAWPLIKGAGESVAGGVRNIVTGFGYFEKIPLIGPVFSGLGWLVDKASEYSGLLLAGAAAGLAYFAFKPQASQQAGSAANMPDAGTGAVGQEPLTSTFQVTRPGTSTVIGEERGPVAIAPVPLTPAVSTAMAANPQLADSSYAYLRQQRVEALTAATANPAFAEQLRLLMQRENQLYENRRQFQQRVLEFTGGAMTGSSGPAPASPRTNLITLLGQNGLTAEEAQTLIPAAPQLRVSVTPGATEATTTRNPNGTVNDFDGRFAELAQMAERMEGFYGVGYFSVTQTAANGATEQVRIRFNDMSVTQKQEFIQKALEHSRTKYMELQPLVRERSAVTSMTRAGTGTVRTWIEYNFGNRHGVYRDENGGTRVRSAQEEWDFLGSLNGNVTSSQEFNNMRGISISGQSFTEGNRIGELIGASGRWQGLLDAHRQEMAIAATTYNGQTTQYIGRVHFMQQSLRSIRENSTALLDFGDNHINTRDLRTFNPNAGPDDSQRVRWDGEWTNAERTSFTVRAITGADGNKIFLREPTTVNLDTGEGMDQLRARIDAARTPAIGVPGASVAPSAPNIGITNISRDEGANRLTVSDGRGTGQAISNQFAGRFEGDRFIATGIVGPGQRPLPPLPADRQLPEHTTDQYQLTGENPVSSTYASRGDLYQDVRMVGPDGRTQIYVLHYVPSGRGWGDAWDLADASLKSPGFDRNNLAWYQGDSDPHIMPGTTITFTRQSKNTVDPHNAAQVAAISMFNPPIQQENANRLRLFQAAVRPADRQNIIALPAEIIIDPARPETLTALADFARFSSASVTAKAAAHPDDPFKTSTHMVQLNDAHLNYPGRVIAHGRHDPATGNFVVDGYELRRNGLPDNQTGEYVTQAGTINLNTRNFQEFFANVAARTGGAPLRPAVIMPAASTPAASAPAASTPATSSAPAIPTPSVASMRLPDTLITPGYSTAVASAPSAATFVDNGSIVSPLGTAPSTTAREIT